MKTLVLDNQGHIYLPKAIRERLSLNSGQELELHVMENQLRLKIKSLNSYKLIDAVPVYSNKRQLNSTDLIEDMRRKRNNELLEGY